MNTERPDHDDAEPTGTAGTTETGGTAGGGPGTRGTHPFLRRTPVVVASVAAAVLLAGGGGAYLVADTSRGDGGGAGSPTGGGTPPPLALDGYVAGSAAPSGADGSPAGTGNGIAPGEPNPYGVVYRAGGPLPDGPSAAPVYWPKGAVGQDEAARLARALGVDGTPVADGDVWRVGAVQDGSGPVLRVNRQAPGLWTFIRYAPGTDDCTRAQAVCGKAPIAPSGTPVSEAVAKKAAAPVLKAVGQDTAKVDAGQVLGAQRVVNADPVVGGLPTHGWTTGIVVGAQGEVVQGNGQVSAPVKGATYPVLSAEDTLELMNTAPGADTAPGATGHHRMGIGGCASPVPLKDRLESPCGASTAAPQKETLTVEDAVFGLAPQSSGGRQVLVPSWLFEVRAKGAGEPYTVTHPAVDPRYLTAPTPSASVTPPPGEPTAPPSPRPSAPGGAASPTGAPHAVHVDGYTAEGTELTVAFTGGVCSDYTVSAAEGAGKVTVTVTEQRHPEKVCIMLAKLYHRTVRLEQPLGARAVVGADGRAVPLEKTGARLPR
ncbi:hypothetical protein AB0G64_26955 [Streptomyces longwoodensis]|uniref:hypothetical protein n=1 Tax=Streptomyces longwoodensis TaxID=68231 RepID=UPI0033DAF339